MRINGTSGLANWQANTYTPLAVHGPLGRLLVLAALAAATAGAIAGLTAGARQNRGLLRWAQRASYAFSACMILANVVMVRALLVHDFSVSYVAHVGSRSSPTWVTIVSLWSSLEGSILFWGLILGVYLGAFAYLLRDRFREHMGYALGTILAVAAFFAFVIAAPANPFLPVSPVPPDGPGANPLLQNHILMVIHPPMLYAGYVGMTVPFGIAMAALLRGRVADGWLKPLRLWTLVPWLFLTIGIVLGGWWAYEVLGWGGYWAWDPVENASLLPWLAATAYLHATVAQDRKGILKAWTLSLVLVAFLLTILGTFMTRSGVFNSVHSFTQSSIGPVFLVFLAVATVISLGLVAGRAHLLENDGQIQSPLSRESAFLLNNAVLVGLTFTVLLGTVFPLVVEAIKGTKLSVGEPYFNAMAVPMGLVLVFLMGIGPALPWGKADSRALLRAMALPLAAGIGVAGTSAALGLDNPWAVATVGVCAFAAIVTLRELLQPAFHRADRVGGAWIRHLPIVLTGNRRRAGGYVVHLAVIVIAAAIALSQTERYSAEASLEPGGSFALGPYTVTFKEPVTKDEAHRFSLAARLLVERDGQIVGQFAPALNYYPTQREPIGTPDVQRVGQSDLYASLLSIERDGSRAGVKVYVIPMVPWIWWSLPVIIVGSLISLWPRRRRAGAAVAAAAPVQP